MDYPEAHICQIENGYTVECYDMAIAEANRNSEHYESPWKKFAAATLEEAFAIIREKFPTGKSKAKAMEEDSYHESHEAMTLAKSRFGGRY